MHRFQYFKVNLCFSSISLHFLKYVCVASYVILIERRIFLLNFCEDLKHIEDIYPEISKSFQCLGM